MSLLVLLAFCVSVSWLLGSSVRTCRTKVPWSTKDKMYAASLQDIVSNTALSGIVKKMQVMTSLAMTSNFLLCKRTAGPAAKLCSRSYCVKHSVLVTDVGVP